MKQISTKEAIGHILCHDITRIVKEESKGVAFKKGHIITEEDIPVLLSLGKDHIYVWEKQAGMIHENEAAEILSSLCFGEHMKKSGVQEGKIEIKATSDGLFVVDKDRLRAVNRTPDMMIATRHHLFPVKKEDVLLGTRIIPLIIEEQKMAHVKAIVGETPLTLVLPFTAKTVGLVTTGNEVYHGRITDTFTPVIKEKLASYGMAVVAHQTVPDDTQKITEAIIEMKALAVDVIICTGGMSVDPDDLTPAAIRQSGAHIETYGAPVLPGAMFLLGYFEDDIPVIGLPGCVMYAKATIFDLVLPSIAARYKIKKEEIVAFGEGGLCLQCQSCTFPNCGFGK